MSQSRKPQVNIVFADNDEFVRALDKLDHTCSEIRALMCIAREEMAKLSSVPRGV